MRFARTGWPGIHGPWRVCLAMSGHALEDGLEAVEPGEVAEDSVEVCGWRRERLAGCCNGQGPMCRDVWHEAGPPGATVNAGARAPQDEGVRDDHSDSPGRSYDGGQAGAAGSDEDRVILRDGSTVVVRPLATGDVAAIAAWFEGLGPETRHARFLGSVAMLDDRTRSQLAQVDHRDHEALTAVAPDGAVVGIARYIRLQQSSTAEVAVAVADRWRGRGIASLLLQQIAARARAAGVDCLTALCLASNTAVLGLLGRLGPITTTPPEAEVIEVQINLLPRR